MRWLAVHAFIAPATMNTTQLAGIGYKVARGVATMNYIVPPRELMFDDLGPSKFRGTPECNESAALHSYGLDAHCCSVFCNSTTGKVPNYISKPVRFYEHIFAS